MSARLAISAPLSTKPERPFTRPRNGSFIKASAPSAAKGGIGDEPLIAAVNRCATQNQNQNQQRVFRPAKEQFSPEFALLIAYASTESTDTTIRELIYPGLDWQRFFQIAKYHRLIPQAYRCLSVLEDGVPAQFLSGLSNLYLANVRQTLRLTRDLNRVLKQFEGRGIPVLAYKGPALAAMFRGDRERQFSDLDLLVDRVDVEKAKVALSEMGYVQSCPLSEAQQKRYLESGYEMAFDLPDARNVLELKWRILPKFYSVDFDIQKFFERSVNVDVDGYSVRTLSPEDLLLVLCVHAAKHAWSELSLLCDISRLVESQPMNWDRISAAARELGIQRIVEMTFDLISKLFGSDLYSARLPQHAMPNERTTAQAFKQLTESRQVHTESLGYFRLMIEVRERWRDRARFFLRLLFTPGPGEWRTLRLPARLFTLYHPVRFWRLVARLVRSLRGRNDLNFSAIGSS